MNNLAGYNWVMLGWWGLALLSLVATAVYSGAEIGIFSLSRVRLRLRLHHQDPAALQLQRWLKQPTDALQGLLILQNLWSFLFTASITAILSARGLGELAQAIVSTAIITPIILVFTEVLPKDLFNSYADRWIYGLAPLLKWSLRFLNWILLLPLVRLLSSLSTRVLTGGREKTPVLPPRAEFLRLFQESAVGGMTATQQDLVQRAMRMARVTIREVMIPWNRVIGVPRTISSGGFRALIKHYNVSRLPVLGRSTHEVLGVVSAIDVLADRGTFDLARHLHSPMTLIPEQSVRSAITLMQRARQSIALVLDHQGRAIGLVTMKDLIEELVGDLENW